MFSSIIACLLLVTFLPIPNTMSQPGSFQTTFMGFRAYDGAADVGQATQN